jgi:hypothetical protein
MSADELKAALREAFEAGVEQGSDEAISADWGSCPSQSRDEAFGDLFEEWNKCNAAMILRLMAAAPYQWS